MSTYVPDETGLGAIPLVEDLTYCRRAATVGGKIDKAAMDACMIRKGFQVTAKGYSRSTGISPTKVLVGVAAAALPAVLPVLAKIVPTAAKGALDVVKSVATPAPAETTTAPAPVPAPRVLAPSPVAAPTAELPPWLLPAAIGGALVLLFALKR